MSLPSRIYDVIVIGDGPAGLATAIFGRLANLSVLVLGRARPPYDKACGEGVMPKGVAALCRMGIDVGDQPWGHIIEGITFIDGDRRLQADFQHSHALGIRRTHLMAALWRKVIALGATREDAGALTAIVGATQPCNLTTVKTLRGSFSAKLVVGADGLHSKTRKLLGLDARSARLTRHKRFGLRQHYRLRPWSNHVEVYFARGQEAYVTPISQNEVGLAFLQPEARLNFADALSSFAPLVMRLKGAQAASEVRGAGPFLHTVKNVVAGSVALVGDAAGYIDAISGEGLSLAFLSAEALIENFCHKGSLKAYACDHTRMMQAFAREAHALLLVSRWPMLRSCALGVLARTPSLMSMLLHQRTVAQEHSEGRALKSMPLTNR